MPSVTIRGNQLLVDGQAIHLRGGEIHYFRLAHNVWEDRLKAARTGGLNTVSSYMPWYFHEPEEGQVDFGGRTLPERNLRRFLDLCAQLELFVIARPGPFVNSELRCGGMPEWLFRDHPETMSRTANGQIGNGRPLPAEGEPVYRDYVRRWYDAVVPLLARYDAHQGGPIILFQPDNELSAAWSFGLLNSLYDPTVLQTTWPGWLKEQYRDIKTVNARHGTRHRSFQKVEPPRRFATTVAEKRRCIDWLNFKRWFFADWGATMARWAIERGIRVPIMFNEPVAGFYNHGDHAGFGAILKQRGFIGTTACHTYSDRILDLEGIMEPTMGIEVIKSSPWGGPPLSVEANVGWYMPRLCRSELNWEPLMRLGLGHGLMGSVIYPYAAAHGNLKDTIDGPEYWDPSCIDLAGNLAGGYRELKRFNRFVEAWEKDLVATEMVTDLTIAYSPASRLLDFLGAPPLLTPRKKSSRRGATPGGESFSAEPALDRAPGTAGHDWLDGYEAVSKQTIPPEAGLWRKIREAALMFTRMNLGYDMLELTNPRRAPGRGWLAVPCTGTLETEAINYLLKHLEDGGGCLFFPTLPVMNLDFAPDQRLAKRLGVHLTNLVRPAGGRPIDYGTRLIHPVKGEPMGVNGWIFCHSLPKGARPLAQHEGVPVIAALPEERGRVIVSGVDPMFTTIASVKLWQTIATEAMGIQPSIGFGRNYYHALLRRGPKASILMVTNVTGRHGIGDIIIPSFHGLPPLTFEVDLHPQEARCLVLNVHLGKQHLLYTTSEMIPLDGKRNRLELHGRCGTHGEMAFKNPTRAVLNGIAVESKPRGNCHVIHYRHGERPLILALY